MNIRDMELLVAVVDAGSFTGAARALYTTQPALSRKIAALEQSLGIRLFERTSRGLEPTHAGRQLYLDAKAVLAEYEVLKRNLEIEKNSRNTLELCYSTNGHVPFVADLIRKAGDRHREIRIKPCSHGAMVQKLGYPIPIMEILLQNYCDLLVACRAEVRPEDEGKVELCRLERGGLCAFAGSTSPLAGRETVDTGTLSGERLLFPPSRYSPDLTQAMLEALGNPGQVEYSSDSTDFRIRVISEGMVGIMPWSSRTIQNEYLKGLPVSDVADGFDLVLLWRKDRQNKALQTVARTLAGVYQN